MSADREIRIRGANTEGARKVVLSCMSEYESGHMKGRGYGIRNCAVWSCPGRYDVAVYHTRTAIVGVYQEAGNVEA